MCHWVSSQALEAPSVNTAINQFCCIGPFLGKNFGTTISSWVVTLDALEPFLVDGPSQEPTPLEYLQESGKTAYDINLEVSIKRKFAK
jgi:fumarylacetoacetase